MPTVALRTIRALRDEVAHAHQLALDSGDAGRLARRLFKTSSTAGNYYAQRFNGVYTRNETVRYIQAMARGQIREGLQDGVASASRATNFASREFARQNPGRNWVFVWRHFPSNRSRPSHVDAAGMTVPAGSDFGIVPPMGSPHCGCLAELQELRVGPIRQPRLPQPRREYRWDGRLDEFTKQELDDIMAKMKQADAIIRKRYGKNAYSRWNGKIDVYDARYETGFTKPIPLGSMDWEGVMHLHPAMMRDLLNNGVEGWHTILHELSHAYSTTTGAQYNFALPFYDQWGAVPGKYFAPSRTWIEEGIAEGFTRTTLERLGLRLFDEGPGDYYQYVGYLEKIRLASGATSRYSFYGKLERMSYDARVKFLSRYVNVDRPGRLGNFAPGSEGALQGMALIANTPTQAYEAWAAMQPYIATHPGHHLWHAIEHIAHVIEAAHHAQGHPEGEHAGNTSH